MPNTYEVRKIKGEGLLWELPYDLMNKFHLKQNRLIILKFGSLSTQMKIISSRPSNQAEFHMGFSERALSALRIPPGAFLSIKWRVSGHRAPNFYQDIVHPLIVNSYQDIVHFL